MRTLRLAITLLLAFPIGGCQTLGLSTPETFNQRLIASYGTVTSVRQAATTLLQAGRITVDDAVQIQNQANNARAGLDVARSLGRTDPKAGEDKLNAVRIGLTALEAYLIAKEKK